MLERLGAAVKGVLKRRLTYDDLYALVESSVKNPAPLDFLTASAEASWSMIAEEDVLFKDHWRFNRVEPLLRAISEQPSHERQRYTLRATLLDEAAKGKWAGLVLKLPPEDADEVFRTYPGSSAQRLHWTLEHVAVDLCLSSLNAALLLQLATRGFGVNQSGLEAWSDFYAEAYGQYIAQVALLAASADALEVPGGDNPNHSKLNVTLAILANMRDEIASDEADVDRNKERYEQLNDLTQTLLRSG